MLPEQKGGKPTPEKIVEGTGWGFLIPPSREPRKLPSDQTPKIKPESPNPPPPAPSH